MMFAEYNEDLRGVECVASYKGVGLTTVKNGKDAQRWNTGNYEQDQQLAHEEALRRGAEYVSCLSSIDHFYMDREERDPNEDLGED